MGKRLAAQLTQLESMAREFGPGCATKCERLLAGLDRVKFSDPQSLIRFHDSLLFLRAFPQSTRVARHADQLLASLEAQVQRLKGQPDAARAFDDETVSGIASTTVTNTLSLELARQLMTRHARQLSAQWDVDEHHRQMALVLPSCIPLLEDDSFVEADTPYLKWIERASGGYKSDLQWLVADFATLPVSPLVRTGLFASLGVEIAWDLRRSSASRTLARQALKKLFCHHRPLIRRKQVALAREMALPDLSLRKLNREEGRAIIDMVQDAVTVRYRELHGTTYGDPTQVIQADVGRGVRLFLWGLDREWRLPLRAYFAGFALKNGVPINYFEAIGLFEWMEVGFNTFYAFRQGETAWIYSQYLRLLHQLAGVTCISVYPYQIGLDNDEAIKSGAFWFYRKLGFRPGRADLLALTVQEEQKMSGDPAYRTSQSSLRKLAEGHMFFEFGKAERGRWDTFSTRTLGLAVQGKMADKFGGDQNRMRRVATQRLAGLLKVDLGTWSGRQRWAFDNFAVTLTLVPYLSQWTVAEKRSLVAIIRAKAGSSEARYLELLQKHDRLRDSLLAAGSEPRAQKR